ncbi:MAG: alpha/beta hydrolase [Gammaproteobacteria bacterium]|nr:alpha/beta hydrolase [Gammaproteobacteria bacterium]MBU1980274.1 alpha/beta hydrolase [Gammaproteobacteria bacterium]
MGSLRYYARGVFALFALLLPVQHATAETVEAKLSTGIIATADFRTGRSAHPAILLLHGFLQTRHAPPMSSLANTLADRGYTVLTPTLTLDINRRAKSLACEAAHPHNLESDVGEIGFWIDWLTGKGFRDIVLIGHSSGSLQILEYLVKTPSPTVRKAILTSLIPIISDRNERQQTLDLLRKKPQAAEQGLGRYTLAYCRKNYAAPPRAYLSYATVDNDQILANLGRTRVPVEVIVGATDTTMDGGWPEKMRSRGVPVTIIEKTGHFFDGEQEFDLTDKVEASLKSLPTGK